MQEIPPVFLIGSERSGTNLLRKLVMQHQKIYYAPPAAHFLKHLYTTEPYYNNLGGLDIKTFRDLVKDALSLCYEHPSPWEIIFEVNMVVERYKASYSTFNSVYLSDFLMKEYAQSLGYKSYFCKDNNLFDFVFEILYFLPNAKFIYLYRDPRDVILSQKKRRLQTDSIRKNAKIWRNEQIKCLASIVHLDSDRIYCVSYEDIVLDSENEIKNVCNYLEVDYIKEPLKVKVFNDAVTPQEWTNVNKPVIKNNINKYKDELSLREIQSIEELLNCQMKIIGYKRYAKVKKASIFYKFWDELVIHLISVLRRKITPHHQDQWAVARNKMLRGIARRRLH